MPWEVGAKVSKETLFQPDADASQAAGSRDKRNYRNGTDWVWSAFCKRAQGDRNRAIGSGTSNVISIGKTMKLLLQPCRNMFRDYPTTRTMAIAKNLFNTNNAPTNCERHSGSKKSDHQLDHLAYSPDRDSCNPFLFQKLETKQKGQGFLNIMEIQQNVSRLLNSIPENKFQTFSP